MNSVYGYILAMALTTYLMRLAPLTLIRKKVENDFIRSFLFYTPYVTLSILVFPSILESTRSLYSAIGGFVVALFLAYREKSLLIVALSACIVVFLIELAIL